jgi:hypothetical protein
MRKGKGTEQDLNTLNHVDYFSVSFENVDDLHSLLVPDEEMARITTADDILILQAKKIDILDSPDVTVSAVLATMRQAGLVQLDLLFQP